MLLLKIILKNQSLRKLILNRSSLFFILLISIPIFGCGILPVYSYKNKRATEKPKFRIGQNKDAVPGNSIASIKVPWNVNPQCKNNLEKNSEIENCARDDKNFVALSISGGGSRSAIFSAAVMFELQNHKLSGSENTKDISLLDQIDVISSVSGGSLTAAYYALSCDDKNNCPETVEQTKRNLWEPKKVYKKLSKSFQTRWVLNTFWPENIFRLWFTNFDRTDVFAETLSDNIYDTSILGGEAFRFQDLNRRRPNLIINASDNTEDIPVEDRYFTFTEEDFNKIKSDLRQFPVGNAVSASSAFPTVFNYATIRDYSYEKKRYRHLFDAGTYDNLGLYSIKRVIKDINLRENTNPEWINALKIVFLIDSHTDRANRKKSNVPEVKGFLNYFVDLSFLDSYDSMLSSFRYQLLETFHSYMNENGVKHNPLTVFSFDSLLKIKNDGFAFEIDPDTFEEKELYTKHLTQYAEGQYVWLVFLTENKEYKYHIDAVTGKILLAARDGSVLGN